MELIWATGHQCNKMTGEWTVSGSFLDETMAYNNIIKTKLVIGHLKKLQPDSLQLRTVIY